MKDKIKVYHLFFALALIVLLIGIIGKENTLDINIHDTYFVITYRDTSLVLFLLYFLNGLGYWFLMEKLNRKLITVLTFIHTVILIGSFFSYWIVVSYYKYFAEKNIQNLFDSQDFNNIILVSSTLLIVFIAQPVYIVNLLIGGFRRSL